MLGGTRHQLVSGHALTVYADQPRAQMGPLALLASMLPRPPNVFLVEALVAPTLNGL